MQSPFAPLLQLSSIAPSPSTPSVPPPPPPHFQSAFAAFANQLRTNQLQNLLQSQVAAFQNQRLNVAPTFQPQNMVETPKLMEKKRVEYPLKKRVGGSTVKTAKVWRFFDELPTTEQAAECRLCRKKIKATNSSTTGMIRHLRSCHVHEYQLVQEARQKSMIVKMEEKARAKLLREMNDKVTGNIGAHVRTESQKSPSASSSASDTASSTTSSLFNSSLQLPPLPPGIPAPKALKPILKCENTEMEDEDTRPTDLSMKSAFCTPQQEKKEDHNLNIHMQVALMLLLDQHPPQVVDRPGFRALFRYLMPEYQLPGGSVFQESIMPQLLGQIRQQLGSIFNQNNPIRNPFENIPMNVEDKDESVYLKREDDSESSSSIDVDTTDSVDQLRELVGNVASHEELSSLLSVVNSIVDYFSSRPHIAESIGLPAQSPAVNNDADRLRYVADNVETIDTYIRDTPDMEIVPISSQQSLLLETIVDKL